jgi:hypothetical protein
MTVALSANRLLRVPHCSMATIERQDRMVVMATVRGIDWLRVGLIFSGAGRDHIERDETQQRIQKR